MLVSSSLSSPPQLLEGPNSSLSVIKSAREMCCVGQTQAALKELHNPLLNLQYVAKPLHLVDWSTAPQTGVRNARASHILTGVSSWAPSSSPRILAAVTAESEKQLWDYWARRWKWRGLLLWLTQLCLVAHFQCRIALYSVIWGI